MPSITMDSRKLLNALNNSAQSKIAVLEDQVRTIGERAGRNYRLAALNNDKLFIEDVDAGTLYLAKHTRRRGGQIEISDITQVRVVEEQKQTLFEQHCVGLIKALGRNDQKGMRGAFDNLAAMRFSPKTIAESGVVKTRDGVVRKIVVEDQVTQQRALKARLVSAIVESITDTVEVKDGQVVRAVFGTDIASRLPVSEWTCRKVVGNHMREAAKDAWRSPGFQNRICKIATLIDSNSLKEAVKIAAKFLSEQQEFCLLTVNETKSLIENALAAKGVFNRKLCEDTAELFRKTNLKENRDVILREWRLTARKAQHTTLLENVDRLGRAKNFAESYEKFLGMVFDEALSPRDEEIDAYRTALSLLRDTPKINEDRELKERVDDLITRLGDKTVDDATLFLVRETLASAKKEVESLDDLNDYDQMSGSGGAEEVAADGETPQIVINSPLIQIGGTSGAAEPAGEPEADTSDLDLGALEGGEGEEGGEDGGLGDLDLGDAEGEEGGMEGMGDEGLEGEGEGDDELDLSALGLGGDEEEGDEDEDEEGKDVNINLDSRNRPQKPMNEGKKPWKKPWEKDGEGDAKDEAEGDAEECEGEECSDPYSFEESVSVPTGFGASYGRSAIDAKSLANVTARLLEIAEEKGMFPEVAVRNMAVVKEAISSCGLRIPDGRIDSTIDAIINNVRTQLTEDQFKFGTERRKGGLKRSSIKPDNKRTGQGKTSGHSGEAPGTDHGDAGFDGKAPCTEAKIVEHDSDNRGFLIEMDGVRCVLDYADPIVLLSEDATVEIPVPANLEQSALAWARLQRGNGKPFLEWMRDAIEQIRPLNESETRRIQEAVATITATGDGTVTVSVDGDVAVDEMPGEMGGEVPPEGEMGGAMGGEIPPEGEMGGELADPEFKPVVDPAIGGGGEDGIDDEMPDFEGSDSDSPFPAPEEPDGDEGPNPTMPPDGDGDEEESEEEETEEEESEEGEEVEESEEPVTEDHDITDPTKGAYDTSDEDVREGPKEAGKAQKPKNGKKLDGFDKKPGKAKVPGSEPKLSPVKPGVNQKK